MIGPRILEHLQGREREMVRLLSRLAEAESPSLDPGTQAAPQAILRLELERLGFVVRSIPGKESGGQLLAIPHERPKGDSIQLMVGHCDTVWKVGTLGHMPVIEKEGRLYGPGTYDMKGGLVNIVFALRALQTLGLQPEVTPIVLINSDEEIGSCDSMRHIKRLAKASERVFILEPALGHVGKLKTARKGNGFFKIQVLGRAAHAGLEPERGASAILELSMLVQRLFALNDAERGISVNVGTIDGGLRTNIVADRGRPEGGGRDPVARGDHTGHRARRDRDDEPAPDGEDARQPLPVADRRAGGSRAGARVGAGHVGRRLRWERHEPVYADPRRAGTGW